MMDSRAQWAERRERGAGELAPVVASCHLHLCSVTAQSSQSREVRLMATGCAPRHSGRHMLTEVLKHFNEDSNPPFNALNSDETCARSVSQSGDYSAVISSPWVSSRLD